MISVVHDMIDPSSSFDDYNKPNDLTDDETKSYANIKIHQKTIKLYVTRELGTNINLDKIHGLVLGQCTHSLQSMIKNENDYKDKSNTFDILWLMKQLKQITAGIDSISNKIQLL